MSTEEGKRMEAAEATVINETERGSRLPRLLARVASEGGAACYDLTGRDGIGSILGGSAHGSRHRLEALRTLATAKDPLPSEAAVTGLERTITRQLRRILEDAGAGSGFVDLAADVETFVAGIGGTAGTEQWFELIELESDLAFRRDRARERLEGLGLAHAMGEAEVAALGPDAVFYDEGLDEYGTIDRLVDANVPELHDAIGRRPFDTPMAPAGHVGPDPDAGPGDTAWDAAAEAYVRAHAPPFVHATRDLAWTGLSRRTVEGLVDDHLVDHDTGARMPAGEAVVLAFPRALVEAIGNEVSDEHHEDAAEELGGMDAVEDAAVAYVLDPRRAAGDPAALDALMAALDAHAARQRIVSREMDPTRIAPTFGGATKADAVAFATARLANLETRLAGLAGMIVRPARPRDEVREGLPTKVVVERDHLRAWRWLRLDADHGVAARGGPFATFELAVADVEADLARTPAVREAAT